MRILASLSVLSLAAAGIICIPAIARAASCRITATTVRFRNYNPLNLVPLNRSGRITVRCSGSGTFTAALSTGQSGSYNPRYMLSGTTPDLLDYNLYTDPSHTSIWGDGSGGSVTVTHVFNNNRVSLTVYGQLPSQQNITPGNYADRITVTVSF